jgi:hypothetical protein
MAGLLGCFSQADISTDVSEVLTVYLHHQDRGMGIHADRIIPVHNLTLAASDTGAVPKTVARRASRSRPRGWRLLRTNVQVHDLGRHLLL